MLNKKQFISFLITLLSLTMALFTTQSCGETSSNGDGYWGLELNAPLIAKAGETVPVEVVGGKGPYKISIVTGLAEVVGQNGDIVQIYFPEDSAGNVTIKVEDQLGLTGEANIYVVKLSSDTSNSLSDIKYFASQVQLLENEAFVGFPRFNDSMEREGSVMYFKKDEDKKWNYIYKIITPELNGDEQFFFASTFQSNSQYLIGVTEYNGGELIVLEKNQFGEFEFKQRLNLPVELNKYLGFNLQFHDNNIIVDVVQSASSPFGPQGFAVFTLNNESNHFEFKEFKSITVSKQNSLITFAANDNELFVSGDNKVYIFKNLNTNYQLIQEIIAPLGQGEYFGYSMATKNQNLLLVSNPNIHLTNYKQGAVNIFEKINDEWQLKNQIQGPDGTLLTEQGYFGVYFGYSVTFVRSDLIAVGTPGDHYISPGGNGTSDRGSVYLYQFVDGEWVLLKHIKSDENFRSHSRFGDVVSATDNQLMIASKRNNYISIYIFRK